MARPRLTLQRAVADRIPASLATAVLTHLRLDTSGTLAELTREARRNEETWRNSQRREMALLESEDLPELLWHLTQGLCRSHRLSAASVALVDPDHEVFDLLRAQGGKPDDFDSVFFVDNVGQLVPQLRNRIRPWLGPYAEPAHGPLLPDGVERSRHADDRGGSSACRDLSTGPGASGRAGAVSGGREPPRAPCRGR